MAMNQELKEQLLECLGMVNSNTHISEQDAKIIDDVLEKVNLSELTSEEINDSGLAIIAVYARNADFLDKLIELDSLYGVDFESDDPSKSYDIEFLKTYDIPGKAVRGESAISLVFGNSDNKSLKIFHQLLNHMDLENHDEKIVVNGWVGKLASQFHEGIPVDMIFHKIDQYADDIVISLRDASDALSMFVGFYAELNDRQKEDITKLFGKIMDRAEKFSDVDLNPPIASNISTIDALELSDVFAPYLDKFIEVLDHELDYFKDYVKNSKIYEAYNEKWINVQIENEEFIEKLSESPAKLKAVLKEFPNHKTQIQEAVDLHKSELGFFSKIYLAVSNFVKSIFASKQNFGDIQMEHKLDVVKSPENNVDSVSNEVEKSNELGGYEPPVTPETKSVSADRAVN